MIRDSLVTTALIAAVTLVFLAEIVAGVSPVDPDPSSLWVVGGGVGNAVAGGQVWRLFTASWLHAGLAHFALNTLALWWLGRGVERVYGRASLLVLWFASGLGGSLLSAASHPDVVSVGASGALFGLFGAQLVPLLRLRGSVPPDVASTAWRVAVPLGMNLVIGFLIPGVDWAGHIGGLVVGSVVAWFLAGPLPLSGVLRVAGVTAGVLTAFTAALVLGLRQRPGTLVALEIEEARRAALSGDWAGADAATERALKAGTPDAATWSFACAVAGGEGNDARIEDWCTHALDLDPDLPHALAYRGESRTRSQIPGAREDLLRMLRNGRGEDSEFTHALQGLARIDPPAADAECDHLLPNASAWTATICAEIASDPKVAEPRWRRVLEAATSGSDVQYLRGRAHAFLGEVADARRDFEAVHAAQPERLDVLNELAWVELGLGDLDAAREHADLAVASDTAAAWNTRCMVRLTQREPAGVEDCKKALSLDPSSVIDRATLAWVEGREAEAEAGWASGTDPVTVMVLTRLRSTR